MIGVRRARSADAAELVRLRRLMFAAMRGVDEPGPWEADARAMLRRQLAEPDTRIGAFVVDAPGGPDASDGPHGPDGVDGVDGVDGPDRRLAACAVGSMEERLPAPQHPAGRFGFVYNVCTDPAHRGRGYARATTVALLEWFARRGVTRVDLHATPDAEHLYRGLGFTEHSIALSRDVSRG